MVHAISVNHYFACRYLVKHKCDSVKDGVVYGAWCMVYCVWCMVHGLWCVGVLCEVYNSYTHAETSRLQKSWSMGRMDLEQQIKLLQVLHECVYGCDYV